MSEKPIEPTDKPAEGGPKIRLIVRVVLLAILGLAIAALGYDRLLARPRNQQEFETVQELVDTKNKNPATKPITNQDVREAVGREPSRVEQKENYTLEFYSWPRGLPTKDYFICVVYSPNDKMLLHDVRQNELPDPNTLPGARFEPPPIVGGTSQPAGPPSGLSATSGGEASPGAGVAPAAAGPPASGLPGGTLPGEETSSEDSPAEEESAEEPVAEEPAAEEPAVDETADDETADDETE